LTVGSLSDERLRTMTSDSAPELNDHALAEEITLLGKLVLAASSVTRHLTQSEVDQVLEVGTSS
jgi:hypothetical protein